MGYGINTNVEPGQSTPAIDHAAILAGYSKDASALFAILGKVLPGMLKGKEAKLRTDLALPKDLKIPKELNVSDAAKGIKEKYELGEDYAWRKKALSAEELMSPIQYIMKYVNKGPSSRPDPPVQAFPDKVQLYVIEKLQDEELFHPSEETTYPSGADRIELLDNQPVGEGFEFYADDEAVRIVPMPEEKVARECEELLTQFLESLSEEAKVSG
jgi:hypothetical protein